MDPSTSPRIPVPLKQETHLRLVSLCILLVAANEACKAKGPASYSSGQTDPDSRLTEYEKFLCKLAQVCDIQKGGDTVTALTVLAGPQGPNYRFTSNNRKPGEFERVRGFLIELLETVGQNPKRLNPKPLKKYVLGRILEFNFPRLKLYLMSLASALQNCIEDCKRRGEPPDSEIIGRLKCLAAKGEFPRDISASADAKNRFLRNCEILIKAIHHSKTDSATEQMIEKYADEDDVVQSRPWCELRHYLGRLQSYRRASEIISDAPMKWPGLFQNFTVDYLPSPGLGRVSLPRSLTSPAEVVRAAFSDLDSSEYDAYIADLQRYRLDEVIREQLSSFSFRSRIHCEVYLHSDLVQQNKTQPVDFWNNSMFIGTSKPTCCLCHYYFQDQNNSDFQLQAPHMNLYMKWQLPKVYEDDGIEAVNRREEVAEGIIEQMKKDTLQILKHQFPRWKTNDSRTDSRTGTSAARGYSREDHYDMRLRTPESMEGYNKTSEIYTEVEEFQDWVDLGGPGEDGDGIEIGGAAVLTGVAR
ncbi:hypothetical protein B0J15DRAFT_483678 [Fusarium solani]|uniref:Uncharacterized protein n=1 Tax=Fusarium solani TaxID=169388 RepID=A0A9P9KYJ2_FUSSL|nr:uncharacterized protein B0J15DRAFT_483678 [Fusarium solani]KAH7270899.1 hypothetical protein B0J15DRAFT_483678 [Fusarium solani]